MVAGKSWGRETPPKKYRKLGFTRREHYAWPHGYQYPIGDAKHARVAARYFGQHAKRYPPLVRQLIKARIEKAKKYFGIGEYRGMVAAHKGKHAFAIRGRKPVTRQRRVGKHPSSSMPWVWYWEGGGGMPGYARPGLTKSAALAFAKKRAEDVGIKIEPGSFRRATKSDMKAIPGG